MRATSSLLLTFWILAQAPAAVAADETYAVDRVQLPLPPGVQLEKASVEAAFTGLFPADTLSARRLGDRMQMKVHLAMRMQKPGTGEEIVVEAIMEQATETRYTPLKD